MPFQKGVNNRKEPEVIEEEVVEQGLTTVKKTSIHTTAKAYDPVTADELCKYIEAGNNIKDACAIVGVPTHVYYSWEKNNKTFARRAARAEAMCKGRNIHVIQNAAEKNWQAAAWYLERKYSDEFALKTKSEVGTKDGTLNVRLVFKDSKK